MSFVTSLEVRGVALGRPVAEKSDGPEDPNAPEDHAQRLA